MAKLVAILPVILIATGCGRNPSEQLSRISEEFVYTALAFSPSTATGVGLHQYQGRHLDDLLDDFSMANVDRQRHFYEDTQKRLSELQRVRLNPEDLADLAMMQDQISLQLLDLNSIHSYLHNPTIYVETLGNALFSPFVLEYAPKPDRIRHIIARLGKVPLFLDQASTNLTSAPEVWTKVAMDENEGNIALVDKTIRAAVPDDLRDAYGRAAEPALQAMRKFQDYLANSLSGRSDYSWRLGGDLYPSKFRYALETGVNAADTLQLAESDLPKIRARMLETALPLHREFFPGHQDHTDLSGEARENRVIGEVLDKIAERHATPRTYLDAARKDLEEARAFVQEKHLLNLPVQSNLQVIPTPVFMRGAYSVGGFNPAPALEPRLGAFYWITPIPEDWPKERIESKLREYNFYGLKLLTVHEAMPGHYVQLEIANSLQPPVRRLLRSVFGNGPYVEGWAVYASQMMLEEGYLNHSPELALSFDKHLLRVIANTILDIRLQMLNMTDEEALDLMEKRTFQEKEEATEKLQRAKLSSAQLPTYYAGWNGWLRFREQFKQAKGRSFSLAEFNDRSLHEGAVPLPVLRDLVK